MYLFIVVISIMLILLISFDVNCY